MLDLISLDPRPYKTKNSVLGVAYYENLNKTTVGFSALEFSTENGEFAKKPLWEMNEMKEANVYKITELSDGNLMIFSENNVS